MKKTIKKFATWLAIVGLAIPLNAMPQKAMALAQNVVVNEIMQNPSGSDVSSSEWIELYNPTSEQIDISDWRVNDTAGADTTDYVFPANTFIGGGELLVKYGNELGITLDNSANTLTLTSDDVIPYIDSVSYTNSSDGSSWGRKKDGDDTDVLSTDFVQFDGSNGVPTPGAKNVPLILSVTTPPGATVTNGSTVTISGTATNSRIVRLKRAGVEVTGSPVTSNSATGEFSFTDIPLTLNSVNSFILTAENGSNAVSDGVNVPDITQDSIAPSAPIINPVASPTSASSQIVTGTAEAGSTVSITGGASPASGVATGGSYSIVVPLTAEATNNLSATATDAAGNVSEPTLATIVQSTPPAEPADTTPPVLTVSSPLDGELIATATPTATYSAIDTNLAGVTVSVDGGTATAYTSGAALGTLANGSHLLKFTATDTAGNSVSVIRTITINTDLSGVSANTQLPANTSNAMIDDTANSGVVLDGINTTGDVTISIGEYTGVPSAVSMPNVSAFGKTFEISASDPSMVTFPLTIKIYYTQTDLDDAGITEDKLDGIYFYNTQTGLFERYSDSGVNPTDVNINGTNYAGYVFANADHLTPVAAASDVIAPSTPTNTTATAGDGKVTLSWDSVSEARNYTVRYRKSTNSDTTAYTYFDVTASLSSQEIIGLANGTEYELGVSAQDRVGNRSPYSVVVAMPKAVATTVSAFATPTIQLASTLSSQTISEQPFQDQSQITKSPETNSTENTTKNATDEGEIKGDATTQTAGSRAAVTLAILLLALAAGVGGYYGYEWWVEKRLSDGPRYVPKEEKVVPTTRKNKPAGRKNNRRNGRW